MQMTRPVAGLAAILLSGGAIFGTAAMAYADEEPTPEVSAPAVVEEVVTPEVVEETVPEEGIVVEDTQSLRVESSKPDKPEEPKKVLVCKYVGTPGVDESFKPGKNPIEVNANSVGHGWPDGTFPYAWTDAHDHSLVIGWSDSGATCPEPQVADVDYVTVGWLAGSAPPNHFDVPQHYLFSEETEEPNLNALDDEIQAYLDELKCGTDADIQVDVYYDNATTDSLIEGEILYGPSNPDEDLIPGGAGTAWKFVHIEAPDCVTNVQCEVYADGGTSTNLDANGWVSIDTRTAGHAEYVEDALHIFTDDATSQAKVSWGHAASFPLSGIGQALLDYDADFGIAPGLNAFVTFAPGVSGTLVWEQVYGGADWWLTNGSNAAIVAPQTGGGFGSNRHGTIDEWLSLYPDAQVTGIAFSLGSGVFAGGDLHSLSLGCATYSFDYENIPLVVELGVSGPQAQCGIDGELPTLPELEHINLEVSPEGTGPGTYTITATADKGYVIDGQAVFEIVVPEALPFQNENNEAPCFVEPKQDKVVDGTPLCGERTFLRTTTVFTLDPVTGAYDNGVSTDERVAVKDVQLCDGLAFTGVGANTNMLWLLGVLLLLAGALAVLIRSQHRHSAE